MRQPKSFQRLLNTITKMVEEEPLADISITSIVNAAGVSRPTFYQHFEDVAAASRAAAIVRLQAAFPMPASEFYGDAIVAEDLRLYVESQTLPVLVHLRAHQTFYSRILRESANVEFLTEMKRFLSGRAVLNFYDLVADGGAQSRDLETIISGGTILLVVEWLTNNCQEDPEALARRVASAVVHLLAP